MIRHLRISRRLPFNSPAAEGPVHAPNPAPLPGATPPLPLALTFTLTLA